MKEVTLIQCTDSKLKTKAKAKDLYRKSRFFKTMRRWAEARGEPWYILSAKHGLVDPETTLEPYDERGLTEEQAKTISMQLKDDGVDTVHITAGRDYTGPLIPELEARGIDVIEHCAGCRIGERRKRLAEKARKLENKQLC